MSIKSGTIIRSTSSMDDPEFHNAVILIAANDESGATAFVINKSFNRSLNELAEFNNSPAFPLYAGGPVDKEHLFFIHRRNDLIPGGSLIEGNMYYGGDFKKAIACINNKQITATDIKIFVGYCGWDDKELAEEIEEGSWEVTEYEAGLAFGKALDL